MVPGSRLICLLATMVLLAGTGAAEEPETPPEQQASASETPPPPLAFIPPKEGAPAGRVGAGTRGSEQDGDLITLLVPEGGGLTTLEKPPLVWHLSADFDGTMVAELEELLPGGWRVARSSEGRFRKGFHALDLARSGVVLAPGRIYRWSVSAVETSSGQVVEDEAGLVERTESRPAPAGDPADALRAAAESGLWFDALVPLFSLTLSGQARLEEPDLFAALAISANLSRSVLSSD